MSKEYKEHKEKKKPNKKAAYETFRRGKDEVAPVLDQCLGWLERNAIDAEGLFRVSGAVRDVEELLKHFEKAQTSGKKVDLSKVKDPHVVAGVTKAWLRELSDPLLTYELYDCFVATAGVSDTEARVACVARIISYLPPGNRATLKRLCQFLRLVELNSARNRMNASNLAICFAPNVLRAKDQSPMSALNEMQAANTLLMTMITYFDVIFLKKEFPKAQEALTKMPEKEKNDIERKFRTGTVRLALAETEDLFDDESDDSTPVMAAPPPRSHHKPLSEVMFEQPAQPATPEPPPKGDKPLTSPRERAQAAPLPQPQPPQAQPPPAHAPHASSYTPAQAQTQAVAEEAKKVDTLKRERRDNVETGKYPPVATAPEPAPKGGSHTDVRKETRSLSSGADLAPVAEDKTEAPPHAVPAAGPKGLIGGVRMVGAGMDLAAVKLKPRPAADPSAAAPHLPPPIVTKPSASTRAPAPATKGLPPPVALDKRKSSEPVKPTPVADPELPPLPAEPLPQPTRTPSNPAITDDLPPIPDEPLPLPPGPPTANTHLNPNPNPNPNTATSTPLSPRGKLPAPITTSPAAPKSKLPSVRKAPPPVPLNVPVNNPPAQHATDLPKALISPKSAKPPPPLVSPRSLPAVAPQPRDLPPPPMLVPPSLMHDKEKDKEREKKEAQEKEREPSRDVPLEKLAEWLLEGRKDDVALYLATLPEAEAKERRVAVKELLAKKLAELDTLG